MLLLLLLMASLQVVATTMIHATTRRLAAAALIVSASTTTPTSGFAVRSATLVPLHHWQQVQQHLQQQLRGMVTEHCLSSCCPNNNIHGSNYHNNHKRWWRATGTRCFGTTTTGLITDVITGDVTIDNGTAEWKDILPMHKGSHNSSKVIIPSVLLRHPPPPGGSSSTNDHLDDEIKNGVVDPFEKSHFRDRLESTIQACRRLKRSSLWIHVPMNRAGLIEDLSHYGFQYHHAIDTTAVLNLWLVDGMDSKIPAYATHNVGVGAVVVNSRNEILCVREKRRNYLPWKTPTGLTELGESLDMAAEREVCVCWCWFLRFLDIPSPLLACLKHSMFGSARI